VALPLLGYAVVTLTGATTSSLGQLRQDPATPLAHQWGTPLPIREDEWLTQTPIALETLVHGAAQAPYLSQAPDLVDQISSGGGFSSVLFFDGNLLRLGAWLPDAMLFAAYSAFPWLLLFLTLPRLLRRLGATRPMSWLGVALCFLAPATLWWSFTPIRILGFAAAGCYLLFLARDQLAARRHLVGVLLAGIGGLCLARLASFYVPWSLTIGVPLVLATGWYLVRERADRRVSLTTIGVGAGIAVAVFAGVLWENWAALHAELTTVYPGLRRVTGQPQPPFLLFGAPGLGDLEDDPFPVLNNQSEISSAFLVCGVWAAVVWSAARRAATRPQWAAVTTLAVLTVVITSWAAVSWGVVGEHVPLLNALQSIRAAQTAGYPAALMLCLVLSRLEAGTARQAGYAAVLCFAVTAYGVSDLQRTLPSLGLVQVWFSVAAVAALVWCLTRWPRRAWPVAATTALLVAAGHNANPVVFGLGDLRGSEAAHKMHAYAVAAEADGSRWVAVVPEDTALLAANGVPTVTGYQRTGPVVSRWEQLDPDHTYEEAWNRGVSYVLMAFTLPEGSPEDALAVISAPGPALISIAILPCRLAETSLGVTHVLTPYVMHSRCVREIDTLTWNGQPRYVYELVRDG
jgi:hypothetical protein